MTSVSFHFNVDDRLNYSCRLVRKAAATGTTLVVIGPDDILTQFDRDLWTFSSTEFVPHCQTDDAVSRVQRSSVVLCKSLNNVEARAVLINLDEAVPEGFEAFDRVIEVVSADPVVRWHARQRWKHYSRTGLELIQHDLSQRTAP